MAGRRWPYSRTPIRCKLLCGWAALFLWAFVLSACSPQTRHSLLTFFFTGVPPLEREQKAVAPPQPAETEDRHSDPALPAEDAHQPVAPPKPKQEYYSHPLWEDGSCAACHQVNKLFSFTPGAAGGKRKTTPVFYAGGGMPGPLLKPKDKLCNECHTDKAGLRAIRENLWIHNPAAKGDCLACHDAHQSRLSAVLRMPVDQLCRSCHTGEKLAGIAMHTQEEQPCLSCHNPHLGKDRRLLTAEYREVKQTARRGL